MSHRTGGLFQLLERGVIYEALQKLLGSSSARPRFVAEFLRPSRGDRILDLGCGTASILDHLPVGVEYTGCDLNPRYIEVARRKRGHLGEFHCQRVGQVQWEGCFDLVLAKAILHHLDPGEMASLIDIAYVALRPGGVLVTVDPVWYPRQPLVARLLIKVDRGGNVLTEEGYRKVLERRFSLVEGHRVTDLMLVPYSHFIARATKEHHASAVQQSS
jgi:SAM-dependent methyltransferase